jgi:hypothetical protein
MIFPQTPEKRYWFGPYEGHQHRSMCRMQKVLGMDIANVETIIRLRNQIVDLQKDLRQLEAELSAQTMIQHVRLARFTEVYNEASWVELDVQK